MKRPMIKGSVLHKASVARAEKPVVSQEVSKADSSLVGAAQALGKSNNPNIIDYTLDNVDVDIDKDAKKVDGKKIYESIKDRLKRKRKEKEAPKVEEEIKEEVVTTNEEETEPEIEDNWSEGESDIDKIEDYFPDDNNNVGNTYTTEDNDNYRSVPVDTPKNPNDLRKQTPIGPANEQVTESDPLLREIEDKSEFNATLAPKNFKLKPINIDSQDLRVKKATRNLSDPKVNIGEEEMEAIKKAEEDRRRANDPLLSEINDRRELKKAGPDNVDPLTREILDQSDRPKPDYTPEYRRNAKASKIDSVDAKLLPNNSDPKLKKAEIPAPKETKLAHENPKYAIKKGVEGKSLGLNNTKGYSVTTEKGESVITYNGVPITTSEVPNDIMLEVLQEQKKQQKNIDLNSNTPSQSPTQKRDDGVWKRAIKGGKVHQGMRKSGYIPPEER